MQLFQLLNFIFPRDGDDDDDIQPNHMRGGIIFQKEITFSAKLASRSRSESEI